MDNMREAFEDKFPPPDSIFWDEEARQYDPRLGQDDAMAEQWQGMYLAWQAALSQQEKSAEPVRKKKSGKVRRRMFSERELLAGLSQQESVETAVTEAMVNAGEDMASELMDVSMTFYSPCKCGSFSPIFNKCSSRWVPRKKFLFITISGGFYRTQFQVVCHNCGRHEPKEGE